MKRIFAFALLCVFLNSCDKPPTTNPNPGGGSGGGGNCSGPAKSFAADVNPIIQSSCASSNCHGASSSAGPGPLTTYSQIAAAKASIKDAVSSKRMPRGSSLTDAQINAIVCWIDNGAPNN
ncbi:MAG TPA: cytochrome c [Chitinophagaceae bacterium]|nr:cytochrome c [Chitinophagaceae bacterium]